MVARVCSQYIQYCERGLAGGTISKSHRDGTVAWFNDLCKYCGARPVAKLKKGHIETWLESHATWRSPATKRSVIAVVLAAFNRAEEMPQPTQGAQKTSVPATAPIVQCGGRRALPRVRA